MTIHMSARVTRLIATIAFVVLAFSGVTGRVHAQVQESTSVGGGTLYWTATYYSSVCGQYQTPFSYYSFSSFTFVQGGSYPLSGSAAYFNSPGQNQSCPPNGAEPTVLPITLPSNFGNCMIYFSPQSGGYGSATEACNYTGYIEPKFLVIGVDYVVPGAQSFQDVCSSKALSTTHTMQYTFSSSYQSDFKVSVSGGIFKFLSGSQSASYSSKATQTSTGSNAVTLATTSSLCESVPGPANSYVPNNHDYDVIWVWLNPVASFTFQENSGGSITGIVFNGYGFNAADQPEMDIYPVYVGCLNGDLSCSMPSLQRTWDTTDNWPSGQGPALTSADYQTILAADPFAMCTPTTPAGQQCSAELNLNPDRFSQTLNQDIPYVQPPVGGQPITSVYTLTNTTTDTQSNGFTTSNQVTYGIEKSFSLSGFLTGISITAGSSQTYGTTYEVDNSLQTSNSVSDQVSITGPPCNVSGGSCNPYYPSPSAPGPTEFQVLEDNIYGTFLLNPVNWYY